MKSIIRRAEIGDLSAILSIEKECFCTDRISHRQMRYLLTKAKAETFVCVVNQHLVGYAIVLLPLYPKPARLYSIAVLKNYSGNGFASELLNAVLEISSQKKYNRISLEVRASHEKVHALYKRFGFTPVSRLLNYYADSEDAIRMIYIPYRKFPG